MFFPAIRYFFSVSVFSLSLIGCGASSDSEDDEPLIDDSETSVESGVLKINEIVAKASDDGNDWIELYLTEGAVDLGGYTIVDNNADREPQSLPSISLSAGDYLLIQAIDADDVPPTSGYYVTFKLGSEDALTLYDNGVAVDVLVWADGDAPEGFSYGRINDGSDEFATLSPTPGSENTEVTNIEEPVVEEPVVDEPVLDEVTNNNTPIRINEVLVKSANGESDWVELFVSGDQSLILSDYSLADENLERVALPEITLDPGEYYRIDVSSDSTSENVLPFSLGSSDEVNLFLGDDLLDSLSWKKGDALVNYSYGRFPDGSDALKTLVPTPENNNVLAQKAQLIINEVVANDVGGGSDWFELYNASENTVSLNDYSILDESDDLDPIVLPSIDLSPGEYFVLYADGLGENDNAVAFKLGNGDELNLYRDDNLIDILSWDASDVPVGYSYGSVVEGSWTRATLEPTLESENQIATVFDGDVVDSIYINIDEADWQDMLANALDEEYHHASISYKDVVLDDVAIRTKGNSSLRSVFQSGSDRFSFKIDLNEYVDGQKLLGLKKFTLNNGYKDPSYIREYLAYGLMDTMGVASPKNAFVNLYVNDELHGLYLMVEVVDGEFLENNFDNSEGDLYKPDGVGSDLIWLSDNFDDYAGLDLETNEDTSDNGAFIDFVREINDGYSESVSNVDNILRYMSVSTALANLDSYHGALAHNFYLYEEDGIFSILPWDLNESFGTFDMDCGATDDLRELTIDEPTSGPLADRPFISHVFSSQDNLDIYHDYLQQLISGPLSSAEFESSVNTIANLIREHVTEDPTSFYSLDEFNTSLTSDSTAAFGLTEFMSIRTANIQQQLDGTIPSSGDGSGYCAGGGMGGGPGGRP